VQDELVEPTLFLSLCLSIGGDMHGDFLRKVVEEGSFKMLEVDDLTFEVETLLLQLISAVI
jgi:hypothetical protein